jgi:hypothetical protein
MKLIKAIKTERVVEKMKSVRSENDCLLPVNPGSERQPRRSFVQGSEAKQFLTGKEQQMKNLSLTFALTTCLVLLGTGLSAQTDGYRSGGIEDFGYLEITIQTSDGNYVLQGLAEDTPDQWPVKYGDPKVGNNYSGVVNSIEEGAEFIYGGTVSFDGVGDYEIYFQKPKDRDECADCLPGDIDRFDTDESGTDFVGSENNFRTKPHIEVPRVEIFVESTGPTVVPLGKGDLGFQTGVINHENETVIGDLWFVVQEPSGKESVIRGNFLESSGPLFDQEILPGFFELGNNTLNIPVSVVTGKYSLKARIGRYPDITIDEDSFDFFVEE